MAKIMFFKNLLQPRKCLMKSTFLSSSNHKITQFSGVACKAKQCHRFADVGRDLWRSLVQPLCPK